MMMRKVTFVCLIISGLILTTVFATSRSGKTHTVVGDISKEKPLNEDASGNHHGIISRAAEAIFAALEKDGENNPDQTVVKCTCK